MVSLHELEPSATCEDSKEGRVKRAELGRTLEIGAEELLRLADQESLEIFEEALPYFYSGDVEMAEKAYRRIEVRDP